MLRADAGAARIYRVAQAGSGIEHRHKAPRHAGGGSKQFWPAIGAGPKQLNQLEHRTAMISKFRRLLRCFDRPSEELQRDPNCIGPLTSNSSDCDNSGVRPARRCGIDQTQQFPKPHTPRVQLPLHLAIDILSAVRRTVRDHWPSSSTVLSEEVTHRAGGTCCIHPGLLGPMQLHVVA